MPQPLIKAQGNKSDLPTRDPRAWEFDPHQIAYEASQTGYYDDTHPGTAGLDFATLARMARVNIVAAVIGTRINQVAEYCTPAPHDARDDSPVPGVKLRLRDSSKSPTRAARKELQELSEWLQRCGHPKIHADPATFEGFTRALIRDSLRYDQACFEVVPNRRGRPAGFFAVDAATIRRAKLNPKEVSAGRRLPEASSFVQVIHSQVTATYPRGELAFCRRRPRTDLNVGGYGFPELEELIGTITNWINAHTYNSANFRHGVHSAGVLALQSKMDRRTFRAIRRDFYALMSGAANAHKTPLVQLDPTNKESLQFINMGNTNRDMEYMQWLGHCMRLVCAFFGMDPSELGFFFGNEGQTNSLSTGNPAQQIAQSKERGLRPLLRAYQSWLNRYLIHPLNSDFELVFIGLDGKTENERLDSAVKSVQHFKTINEVRAEFDLEPLEGEMGEMIQNASYMSTAMQMQAMQAGGQEGESGDGGEFAPGEGEAGVEGQPEGDDDADDGPLSLEQLFGGSDLDGGVEEGGEDG